MAIECIEAVFNSAYGASGSRLAVLLYMAERADKDGCEAWPSLSTVARACRISRRMAGIHVNALAADGVLVQYEPDDPKRRTRTFRLDLDALGVRPIPPVTQAAPVQPITPVQYAAPVQSSAGRGETERQQGCNPVSPGVKPIAHKPSFNRPKPSEEPLRPIGRLSPARKMSPEQEQELAAIPYPDTAGLSAFKRRHGLSTDVTGLRKRGVQLRKQK